MNNLGSPLPIATEKPGKVQAVAIMTLVSAISNVLWMIFLAIVFFVTGLSTLIFGVGVIFCLALPLFIPPLVLAVFEILYAVKILPTPIKPTKPAQVIAILEIVCVLTGNLVAVATGIVAMVMYSDPVVKAYFEANSIQPVV